MGNKIKEKHVKQYKINVICCFDNKIVKKIYIYLYFLKPLCILSHIIVLELHAGAVSC